MYEVVCHSNRRSARFGELHEALKFAKDRIDSEPTGHVIPIWREGEVAGVVFQDDNGVFARQLDGSRDHIEQIAWEKF